jgi:hypothetical protein
MKAVLVVLFGIGLVGCDSLQTKPSDAALTNMSEDIRYFQDARSGQCYASIGQRTDSIHPSLQITWVPCDPKVLALVGK